MIWGRQRDSEPVIGVWRMLLALAFAAFLGGALGLVWQSAGFGEDEAVPEDAAAAEPAD